MKKISTLFFALLVFSGISFGQTKKVAPTTNNTWVEKTNFLRVIKPAYEGVVNYDYKNVKENIGAIYSASKVLYESKVPADYKTDETKAALNKIMMQCANIQTELTAGAETDKIREMTIYAYMMFSKIDKNYKK
jgi:hypothetical protein